MSHLAKSPKCRMMLNGDALEEAKRSKKQKSKDAYKVTNRSQVRENQAKYDASHKPQKRDYDASHKPQKRAYDASHKPQ